MNEKTWLIQRIAYLASQGYTELIAVKGIFHATDLCLHTKMYGKEASFALVRRNENDGMHAYVWAKDGSSVDGSFYLFPDGTFSVS